MQISQSEKCAHHHKITWGSNNEVETITGIRIKAGSCDNRNRNRKNGRLKLHRNDKSVMPYFVIIYAVCSASKQRTFGAGRLPRPCGPTHSGRCPALPRKLPRIVDGWGGPVGEAREVWVGGSGELVLWKRRRVRTMSRQSVRLGQLLGIWWIDGGVDLGARGVSVHGRWLL